MANNDGFDIFMRVGPAGGAVPGNAGPTCRLEFGSESQTVNPTGKTVQQLFLENAEALGFDRNRAVAYRAAGKLVDPATPATAGVSYIASISYEQKGC